MNNKLLKLMRKLCFWFAILLIVYLAINPVYLIKNYFILKVPTESMVPTIKPVSVVIAKKVESYSVGDIIAYKNSENKIIVHRIVKINGETVVAKGDNNKECDEAFNANSIQGKIICILSIVQITLIACAVCVLLPILVYFLLIVIKGNNNANKENAQKINKFFDVLSLILLIFVLAFTFIYFTDMLINKPAIPDVLGYTPLMVASGSMEPTIKTHDVVIVKKTHYSQLKKGDIIVYFDKLRDITVIHRLIKIEDGEAITKGDANFVEDIPFPVTQIYGKYLFTIPFIGQTADYLKNHMNITFLCITIVVAYLSFDIITSKRNKKQKT